MRKTILSHFYNEEYLLPWFLKQHKNIFDYGIMVNYASTDNSVKIIKERIKHKRNNENDFFIKYFPNLMIAN